MRPRIAIPYPHSQKPEYNQRALPQYLCAIEISGGEPVPIDLGLSNTEITKIAMTCDGVLLPGSPADVDPEKYGAARDPQTAVAIRSGTTPTNSAAGRVQHAQAGSWDLLWRADPECVAHRHPDSACRSSFARTRSAAGAHGAVGTRFGARQYSVAGLGIGRRLGKFQPSSGDREYGRWTARRG